MLTRRSLVKAVPAAFFAARSGIPQALAFVGTTGTGLPARDAFVTPQFEVCLNNARWHPLSIAARTGSGQVSRTGAETLRDNKFDRQ